MTPAAPSGRLQFDAGELEVPDDVEAACDVLYAKGWTDGLPVIPPIPERVEVMVAGTSMEPSTMVAELDPRRAKATVENIAINAVMAGCKPEDMPVLIAAVRAIAAPAYNLHAVVTTTNSVAPMAVVNGPIRNRIGINSGRGALGPGVRANAAIGRAIKLVMTNVGGGIPREVDKAILGLPAKYTCCFGEDEEGTPWEPLHVEQGFTRDDSAVTMFGVSCMVNTCIIAHPEQALDTQLERVAEVLRLTGSNNWLAGKGDVVVVVPRGWAHILDEAGFGKSELRSYLWELGSLPEESWPAVKRVPLKAEPCIRNGRVYVTDDPAKISLIVAGSPEPYHVMVMSCYAENDRVTERITP